MIAFEEAYRIVTTDIPVNDLERLNFEQAEGRILAEDIRSDMDMPPFDKAAVDGFACRRADLEKPLRLVEVVPAGKQPQFSISEGCCSKVMTGAPVPEGADCVVMVEQTRMHDAATVVITDTKTKSNIASKAEDIRKGSIVISKGVCIKPQHIAVLASVGATQPLVYKKVRLVVLSTGDELVEPSVIPGPGQIRNSNAQQLLAQAKRMHIDATYGGIVADTEDSCRRLIGTSVNNSQVVILSGGISMGDFDYVPAILKELGFKILFKSIAVQSGRPTVFARSEDQFVLALPGNPVSSFNIFELLAKPFLYRMMGYTYNAAFLRLPLAESYSRRSAGRLGFVPAAITEEGMIRPIYYHGSAHINALVDAHAIFAVPQDISDLNKGDLVDVRLI